MTTDTKPANVSVIACEPLLRQSQFSDRILDKNVNFFVLKLEDSFFLWIGTEAKFSNLAVAMATKFISEKSVTGSNLMGDKSDPVSSTLAIKLAKKTGKQVFVSYNLPSEQQLLAALETRIIQEVKNNPDIF